MKTPSKLRSVAMTLILPVFVLVVAPIGHAGPPSFLKLFGKRTVASDPQGDYRLTEIEGPWLILAATFTGEMGRTHAQELVLEFRSQYNLPAFVYEETFDFTGPLEQPTTTGRQLRYANATRYAAFAVLVGEFDSYNHPDIEKTLRSVKTMRPKVFSEVTPEDEVGAMSTIRRIRSDLLGSKSNSAAGPMYNAYLTRNPLLPETFTQAPEVDSFVSSLNKNVEYSLLDCEARYTVVVRTFEGLSTTMIGGKTKNELNPDKDRLDASMAMANKMVIALRKKGVEAYEFHDRTRSIVTVGSFDSLGTNSRNGFQYAPEIQKVMQDYAANEQVGRDPNGNYVRYVNNIEKIPFDVRPYPIAVPRITKRSLYSGALGLNP